MYPYTFSSNEAIPGIECSDAMESENDERN